MAKIRYETSSVKVLGKYSEVAESTLINLATSSKRTLEPEDKDEIADVDKDIATNYDYTRKLAAIGFKKFKSVNFNEDEYLFLKKLSNINTTNIKNSLYKITSKLLLYDKLGGDEICTLKLCLSGIINMVNPNQIKLIIDDLPSGWNFEKLNIYINEFKSNGISTENLGLLDEIIDICFRESNIDTILVIISKLQVAALSIHGRQSQKYIMLSILKFIIESIEDWSDDNDKSELTIYRRFATIMDILFRNSPILISE
ncbi:unnamed protein product [Cunninghamella echinulata]